jgi:hypothetical protein
MADRHSPSANQLRRVFVAGGLSAAGSIRAVAIAKCWKVLIKSARLISTRAGSRGIFVCIDESLQPSAIAQRDRAAGQVSLFDEQTHAATQ